MTFQTPQNNQNNRDKNSPEELPDEICSIWLGIGCVVKTFQRGSDEKIDTNEVTELGVGKYATSLIGLMMSLQCRAASPKCISSAHSQSRMAQNHLRYIRGELVP